MFRFETRGIITTKRLVFISLVTDRQSLPRLSISSRRLFRDVDGFSGDVILPLHTNDLFRPTLVYLSLLHVISRYLRIGFLCFRVFFFKRFPRNACHIWLYIYFGCIYLSEALSALAVSPTSRGDPIFPKPTENYNALILVREEHPQAVAVRHRHHPRLLHQPHPHHC